MKAKKTGLVYFAANVKVFVGICFAAWKRAAIPKPAPQNRGGTTSCFYSGLSLGDGDAQRMSKGT